MRIRAWTTEISRGKDRESMAESAMRVRAFHYGRVFSSVVRNK